MLRSAQLPRLMPVFGAVLLLAGCASYHLGTGSSVKFTTLFIVPVVSKTTIPQARVPVTTQLREAFLHDGRVRLVNSPEAADAILQVVLTSYDRTVAVALPTDTGRARRFDITLRAQATLTNNRTKQAWFTNRELTAQRGVFTDSGLVPSEYQTLPLLAEDLAAAATHAVLDTW